MAKKVKDKSMTTEMLKELIWQKVMTKGVTALEYDDDEIEEYLREFSEDTKIEIPAFKLTLSEIQEVTVDNEDCFPAIQSALEKAVILSNDIQARIEHHENEMARHAKMVDALTAEAKTLAGL